MRSTSFWSASLLRWAAFFSSETLTTFFCSSPRFCWAWVSFAWASCCFFLTLRLLALSVEAVEYLDVFLTVEWDRDVFLAVEWYLDVFLTEGEVRGVVLTVDCGVDEVC